MCTVSWGYREQGYRLIFNRDEQRARHRAQPPQLFTDEGTRYLSPTDPQGGGSWISASERGLSLCLLNYYEAQTPPTQATRSRGLLVRELADSRDLDALSQRIQAQSLQAYAPFILLGIGSEQALRTCWNGQALSLEPASETFETTSSFQSEAVCRWRQDRFKEVREEAERDRYHDWRETDRPAYGPTMDREDARTVSQTRIVIAEGLLQMDYRERSGEGFGYGNWQALELPLA